MVKANGNDNPVLVKNTDPKLNLGGQEDKNLDPNKLKVAGVYDMYGKELDPTKIWQKALSDGPGDPGLIIATADFLFENEKYDHAAEFLKANLRLGIVVRPWVYEALALALEASGGSPEEIRRARLSAVALDPKDAQGFLSAARALAEHKEYDRALSFCRQAAELEPNLPVAYAQALAYARQGKDGKAMEWAAGRLLGQDWPVDNAGLHKQAQSSVEALAQ